jgi:hypothetical protein
MKRIIACAALLLLPVAVGAQTYNVDLDGGTGTGFAAIFINGSDIDYTIISSGLDPAPTSAELTDGSDTVDLLADFDGTGTATGSVTTGFAGDIVSNPSAWTLEVSNGTDTLSGTLSGGGGGGETDLYLPVAAAITGAGGTAWKSDARIVNRTGETATVTLEYYPEGAGGNTAPDATETVEVGPNEQAVLDDFVADFFGETNGKGGVTITSDRAVTVATRVYNDQTDVDQGTLGLAVNGIGMDQAYRNGLVPLLQNRSLSSGTGFRGSIGWFNPNTTPVEITFYGWDTDGTLLGETTRTVAGQAMQQFRINGLWSSLNNYGDMYVTYSADGDIFVYGTIADNVSTDGTYIPAVQSN